MKKNIFLAAAACCICFCASAFKTKKDSKPFVTNKMEQSLSNEFGNQSQIKWNEAKDNTVQASLQVNGQAVNAFFGNDGEYICSTTQINKENLPLKLRLAIDKKLANVNISAIVQTNTNNETIYFFQGVDTKGVKVWKGTANGNIEFVQKL